MDAARMRIGDRLLCVSLEPFLALRFEKQLGKTILDRLVCGVNIATLKTLLIEILDLNIPSLQNCARHGSSAEWLRNPAQCNGNLGRLSYIKSGLC